MWKKGFVIENDTSGRNTVEKEMVSYIQQNFTGKISLREFGEQFHLSEKYISRYFKEHFHITLSQYVTYLRLEHAKQLLQDTDIPVTDVAMQSGYQNVSYFIRSFQKAYAVSPLKYRKIIIADKLIQEAQQSFYDGTIIDKYTIGCKNSSRSGGYRKDR